jgi:predicted  nucleic acid-binding Zn-ribbon protein
MKVVSRANASLNERADANKIKIEKLTQDKKVLNKTIDQLDEDIASIKHKKNDEIKRLQRKIVFLEEDLYDLEDKLRPHKKTRPS